MSRKYSTSTTLVIIESPAKCKKIEEYLGPGYKCIATFGHLREIISLKNIDINNGFTPTYTIIEAKKKQIDKIKKEIKLASTIILAQDADLEGEMIAYSVIEIFKLPITTPRIKFNEITETAIQFAIRNPTIVDLTLVYAQRARQILDILVGFKVSPTLWSHLPKEKDVVLSAGRCQTPALRLVYENEQERNTCNAQMVYKTIGYFTNLNLVFELTRAFESVEDTMTFLRGSVKFSHEYTCSNPVTIYKHPPEPFTTSRIQQVASNELRYSPKETMRICQQLYEGGYITYMRTDSSVYCDEFVDSVKTYIKKEYIKEEYIREEYIREEYKKDKDVVKGPHEAIRPTNISLYNLPETLDSKQKKLYKLIWTNTLESCMSSASFNQITASISAFQNNTFICVSEICAFPGWKIVSKKYLNEPNYSYLQTIRSKAILSYKKMYSKSTIIGTKPHFTEARLVQLLEEKGIGRPSTFASLIEKIQEREYIKKEDIIGKEIICKDFELEYTNIKEATNIKEITVSREFGNEKGKLVIQPLGIRVMEFLEKHFNELFTYDYTRKMEDSLDKIAHHDMSWTTLCSECNNTLDTLIQKIGKEDEDIKEGIGKEDKDIGKDKGKDKEDIKEEEEDKKEKVKTNNFILGQFNGKNVILRKGKFGLYVSCDNISKSLPEFGNRPIENIRLVEVLKYLEEGSNLIREISKHISIRRGSNGDYIFYKTPRMKKPSFFDIKSFTEEDYKICDIHILKSWIKERYQI